VRLGPLNVSSRIATVSIQCLYEIYDSLHWVASMWLFCETHYITSLNKHSIQFHYGIRLPLVISTTYLLNDHILDVTGLKFQYKCFTSKKMLSWSNHITKTAAKASQVFWRLNLVNCSKCSSSLLRLLTTSQQFSLSQSMRHLFGMGSPSTK